MEKLNIKINYLYHSGFTIETKNYFLVFDYYKDSEKGNIAELLRHKKNIVIFSSHGHGDHFNREIFTWKNINQHIKYILSNDIKPGIELQDIYFIAPYQELNFDGLYVKTFGSTDLGVSFKVQVDGVTLFHAGDLNWWHWYDESEKDNLQMEKAFKEEVEKLKGEHFDLVFFPVDPRLKDSYTLGVKYFMEKLKPAYLIPMHFGDNYEPVREFINSDKNLPVKVLDPLSLK